MTSPDADQRAGRVRDRLVLLLALNSGATDAIGFIALGGAFTSVMTGNLVLLGLSVPRQDGTLALHSLVAIVGFVLGAALGARVAGTPRPGDGAWPRPVTTALGVQLALTVGVAIVWEVEAASPDAVSRTVLLVVDAVALGIQSSPVQRFGRAGLSTPYLTGTLTQLVIKLTSGQSIREVRHSAQLLFMLVFGAAIGAALVRWAAPVAVLVPVACLVATLVGQGATRVSAG